MEHVERDVYRGRGQHIGVRLHEQVEPRDQPLIEHSELAVQDQVGARQCGDGLPERSEAGRYGLAHGD